MTLDRPSEVNTSAYTLSLLASSNPNSTSDDPGLQPSLSRQATVLPSTSLHLPGKGVQSDSHWPLRQASDRTNTQHIPRKPAPPAIPAPPRAVDFANSIPQEVRHRATPHSAPLTIPSHYKSTSPVTPINRHTLPSLPRRRSSTYLPIPGPQNNYLNFCPGAWRLQVGDRNALEPVVTGRPFLRRKKTTYACSESGCAFREQPSSGSGFSTITDAGLAEHDTSKHTGWGKAAKGEVSEKAGIRFRPSFLAKSHVSCGRARDGLWRFQCMFCAFRGVFKFEVLIGVDALLAHVATHRKEAASLETEVLERARCIAGRRATEEEPFDVNLVPLGQAWGERQDDRLSFAAWAKLKVTQENESEGDRLIKSISLSQIRQEPHEKRMGFIEWIKAKVDEENLRTTEWPGLA
ncbi:MAG: hypothetical protein M1828_000863 [Chrysothrix sp. TS-e1954]|nr:MAG: hypothetical protein M1828_000863 [Chrysothrix sp. TS-e1954]